MPKGHSRVISVDFDGTIFDFNYPYVGPIKPGVQAALKSLRDAGWWVVIHSCRTKLQWQEMYTEDSDGGLIVTPFHKAVQMAKILDHYAVPFDEISLADKPLALYYVDDRGVSFGCPHCGPDWATIAERILGENRNLVDLLDLSPNEIKEIEAGFTKEGNDVG